MSGPHHASTNGNGHVWRDRMIYVALVLSLGSCAGLISVGRDMANSRETMKDLTTPGNPRTVMARETVARFTDLEDRIDTLKERMDRYEQAKGSEDLMDKYIVPQRRRAPRERPDDTPVIWQ